MKITFFLFISNIFIFLLQLFNPFLVDKFSFNKLDFLSGKYYLPLTSMFLHANIYHLFYNMIALLLVGPTIEKESGKALFFMVYFLSGYIGALSLIFYKGNPYGMGASSAISGLIGFGAIKFPTKIVLSPIGVIMPLPFIVVGSLFMLINFLGLFIPSEIGFLSHLFGFFTGALIALLISKKKLIRIIVLFILAILFYFFFTYFSDFKF